MDVNVCGSTHLFQSCTVHSFPKNYPGTPHHPQRRHDKVRLQRRFSNSWRVETNTAWEESFLRVTPQHPSLKVQCFGCFTRLYTAICDPFGPMWPSQQTNVKIECIKYTHISTHTNAINQLIDYRTSTSVWDELWWLEYVNGKHGNTTQYRYWYLFASCQSMPKQQIKQKTRCKPSIWWSDCWLPFGLDTTFRSWFGQLWELVQPSHYCCIRYANICSHPS